MDETNDSTSNWKPIDTAPKDGSDMLLLYQHISGDRYIIIGCWHIDGPYWTRDDDSILEEWAVTHWMDLPDVPPEEELPK